MRRVLSSLSIVLVSLSASILTATSQQSSASPAAAEALLKQGKVNEALPLLLQLHESQPQNSQVCLQLGVAYTQLQQLDKAVDSYTKALKINPGITPARRNLATLLWFVNRKSESVREFSSLIKLNPNDSVAHFYLGTFDFEQKQFLMARDHFAKAGDLAFGNPEALPMVLETYLIVKDTLVPSRVMKQLRQAEHPDPELINQVAILFLRYENYAQAIMALERLSEIQSKPEVYLMLAEAYDKERRPDDAYRALSRSIELEPKSEDGYLALAAFSSDHHNTEFALKVIDQGLEKIPGSSRLLLQKGILWALDGDLLKAEVSFQEAGQAKPDWTLPQLALGVTQLQAGRLGQAAETFQKVARQESNDYRAEYLYALSLTRAGAQGDATQRNKIIAALRRATDLNPKDSESRVLLGQTYLAAGQLETAITELRKAIELNPRDPAAYYQLGVAYRKQGKQDMAQRQLRSFEQLKAQLKEEENEEKKALVQMLKVVKTK